MTSNDLLDDSLHVLGIPVRVINTLESYYRFEDKFWYVRTNGKELTTFTGSVEGSAEPQRGVQNYADEEAAQAACDVLVRQHMQIGYRNVITVRDLLAMSEAELLKVPNFGLKTLESIYERLAEKGFYRKGRRPEPTQEDIVAARRARLRREALGFNPGGK